MNSVHILQIGWFVLMATISGVSDIDEVDFNEFGDILFKCVEF